MFGAGFIPDRRRDFLDEYRIPGRRHADGLGKNRGTPIPRDAVVGLHSRSHRLEYSSAEIAWAGLRICPIFFIEGQARK